MEDTKVKEAIASLMKDRSKREALAEMITEYVQPNHITQDIMSQILDTRALKPGDSLVRKIRKGINVHTWVPGSIGLKSEITVVDRINYVLDSAIVGVLANEWELESGELGTVESIRAEAMAKLKDYYMNKVFTALTTIWTAANTPLNYTNVGGHVTQVALENAINYINQTTSGVKAIVGVRAALTPIMSFAAWQADPAIGLIGAASQSILDEVKKSGWLGSYWGAPLVTLNQIWDNPDDHNALLPVDKILIIGQNTGEFVTYGEPRYKEWTDNEPTPPYWHMDLYSQFGLLIDNADGIFVLGNLS